MAVYTPLSQGDIVALLADYNIGELESFKGISEGVSNTNYLLNTNHQSPITSFILTLFEKYYKLEDLPYFVALMQWWRARGIYCPQPISKRDGSVLAVLKDKPAIIVSFLDGAGVEPRKITPDYCYQLGELAAKMHVEGAQFTHQRDNGMSLSMWEKLIDKNHDRFDDIESGLRKLVAEEYNFLTEHWPSDLPAGAIHADLFPDNVFFKDKKLSGVIDFYFSCHDFWAYDLAICVNAWCFDVRGKLEKDRVQALMQGYNQLRPMTVEEEKIFPVLLRGAALRFLLTRADSWLNPDVDADMTAKDPREYIEKLKFFQNDAP